MAKIEITVSILCVCGEELHHVARNRTNITVTPCRFCQEEARRQAYNKGLEYGRKSKD